MSAEQLRHELMALQQENRQLQAQLNLHRELFKEVNSVLGAANFLMRNTDPEPLLDRLMLENEQLKNELKIQKLSLREKEILQLVGQGFTSKQIADKLDISKLTVDSHRKNIQQKLEIDNTVELIRLALRSNLS